ncbi:hypothetical protein [Paenibacillus flagellatus]|uniref:Uncharacterized protein n=1 Tax=Paenibacillus flagellatus TaxID=2211139 RepID=A0A2V5K950_9BACL|nr:hypothetical protein [Paenibacillus flagellatus]PYI54614.1 hypothetical protein DLM86_14250 [Paenibacillus flagellatus]
MERYWLTPITGIRPLTLGADRFVCAPPDELAGFRRSLDAVHPRLLLSFKARLLLPDTGAGGSCGAEDANGMLDDGRDVVFDSAPLPLSDCGMALLDRLLAPAETASLLETFEAGSPVLPASHRRWLAAMRDWTGKGWSVILLKEGPET